MEYYEVKHPDLYLDASMNLTLHKKELLNLVLGINKEENFVFPEFYEKIHCSKGEQCDAAWKKNLELIQKQVPVIAYVDVYHMSYLPNFMKEHGIQKQGG